MRRRLDVELVRRGLSPSRARARAAIDAGVVLVSGSRAERPGRLVAPAEPIHVERAARFVSRGGEKLDAALTRFGLPTAGLRALDAGASTGGFTDCLLRRGAAQVIAVDVGRGQLAWSLRSDPRVVVRDGTNVRHLAPGDVGGPVDLVVADLSFISLRTVAPALVALSRPGGPVVALVKPQFEAGRGRVGRTGVVRDPAVHLEVLGTVTAALAGAGLRLRAVMASPIRGAAGNIEFLGHFRVAGGEPPEDTEETARPGPDLAAVVAGAHAAEPARDGMAHP